MPVTAKLSRRFYEKLGDDVANELVEWFNSVDLSYRTDLRELNEVNFGRFDAKVEQRFAESDARLEKRFAEYSIKSDKRFTEQDAKFDRRFAEQDAKFDKCFAEQDAKFDKRFAEQDAKFEKRFADLDVTLEKRFAEADAKRAAFESRMMRWMFIYWTGTMIGTAGLVLAVMRVR